MPHGVIMRIWDNVCKKYLNIKILPGGIPWQKTPRFHCRGMDLICGWGTKVLRATQSDQ